MIRARTHHGVSNAVVLEESLADFFTSTLLMLLLSLLLFSGAVGLDEGRNPMLTGADEVLHNMGCEVSSHGGLGRFVVVVVDA